MRTSQRNKGLFGWLRGRIWRRPASDFAPRRGPVTHVIILDGTMSSLEPGCETHAGITYKLMRETGGRVSVYYEPGLQWSNWRTAMDVFAGRGINRQIRRAYGYLASRYRPGDRIYLMGYSRGAYAVRSLAGIIDLVGLLRADEATERNIREIYRHYENDPGTDAARAFSSARCHDTVAIEMIGVWDTVKSLGLNLPFLWRLSVKKHDFHNHALSHNVKAGFHALAIDETRVAYSPVLWSTPEGYGGRVEQMWFAGTHGDIGGQLGGYEAARPLANISLVWLLGRAQASGLPLPEGWMQRFVQDATAPMLGTFRGHGKWLVSRRKRIRMQDSSERVHESVGLRAASRPAAKRWIQTGTTV
ncbi:DUF2235 domain-containing protein [Roseobacter ponti]|uniref:DUF2235 domain-containing protein n=1 Tax=Roseobacter ponti TaxID=1891787 RepID=A0A858SQH6_9RHOB|nr:DUF2235 domain-containing protein [Roseobacter ponti]QJF50630.1 DUF2235 domain-containing protein [Roseobacter ponti]